MDLTEILIHEQFLFMFTLQYSRVRKTLRSHGRWLEEGLQIIIETPMTFPIHAYFLSFCEEGVPSKMCLSRGWLTTFLDFTIQVKNMLRNVNTINYPKPNIKRQQQQKESEILLRKNLESR